MSKGTCKNCGHSLTNNSHGPDQNDMYMDGDRLCFTGTCTYCKECNPVFAAALAKAEKEKK